MTIRRAAVMIVALLLTTSYSSAAEPKAAPATEAAPGESSSVSTAAAEAEAAMRAQAEAMLKQAEARLAEVKSKLSFPLCLPNDPDKLFGPAPKPEENAHPVYRQAFKELAMLRAGDDEPRDGREEVRKEYEKLLVTWGIEQPDPDDEEAPRPEPRNVERARRFLDILRKGRELRDKAALLPSYRSDTKWSDGIGALLPELSEFRLMMNVTFLGVAVDLADGRATEAYGHVANVLRMARHMEQEPCLVTALVAMNLRNGAARELANVLAVTPPDEKTAMALRPLLVFDGPKLLGTAMSAETNVFNVSIEEVISSGMGMVDLFRFVQDIRIQGPAVPPPVVKQPHPATSAGFRSMQANYLEFMDQMARASREPAPKALMELRKQEDWLLRIKATQPVANLFTVMLAPAVQRSAEVIHSAAATGRMAQVAIDVAAFKKANGEYPDALSRLPGADKLPVDPFSEKPFNYRREGAGFVLWSVGPDGDDDGGMTKGELEEADKAKGGDDGDVVFRVLSKKPEVKKAEGQGGEKP